MTYFLSLEKSLKKPSSTRFNKENNLIDNQINNNKEENTDKNSVRINKYKWKLLPKQKYYTQIYEENNLNIIKKEKEEQNKIIKLLENKIKNLEKKYMKKIRIN